MTRAQLKAAARQQLRGNIGILLAIALVTALITGTFIGSILLPGIVLSLCAVYLNMTDLREVSFGDMFCRLDCLGKAWWLSILTGFFIMLWSILFVIPGIIKAYAYSMAPYVLAENPNLTAREALHISKEITRGHKMDLFILELSFLGWNLLIPLTFGLAAIWVIPYRNATLANFYNAIK